MEDLLKATFKITSDMTYSEKYDILYDFYKLVESSANQIRNMTNERRSIKLLLGDLSTDSDQIISDYLTEHLNILYMSSYINIKNAGFIEIYLDIDGKNNNVMKRFGINY